MSYRVVDEIADVVTYLSLTSEASAPYDGFVYVNDDERDRTSREFFNSKCAEFAPPYAHAIVDGSDQIVGMFAGPLSRAELSRVRLQATRIVLRVVDPATKERIKLAGTTLLKLEDGDRYLSRIAVMPSLQRRGIARVALESFLGLCRTTGGTRAVLEVASTSHAALALYRHFGFEVLGEHSVADALSGRQLTYVHMAKSLS